MVNESIDIIHDQPRLVKFVWNVYVDSPVAPGILAGPQNCLHQFHGLAGSKYIRSVS